MKAKFNIRARAADWLREGRISLRAFCCVRLIGGSTCLRALARSIFSAMRRDVDARSPSQVERMERARGLR